MKIDVYELSPVQRKVHVEVAPEVVANELSRAYKNLGQRVRVKGFRTGKTPRQVLQGIYGDEVKGQVRSRLVEESLGEIIKERGLQIVSRPEIDADELQENHPFSFSAVFEIKPEIEIRDYLGIEVERIKLVVSDAQVNEALGRLQQSHARLEPVDNRSIVERGDFAVLDFEGSIDGKTFAGGKSENYQLEVGGGRALPQFEEAVVGLRVGEHKTIRLTYPQDHPNRDLAGKAVDFALVVREIKHKVVPLLDDDFAKDHGECDSLEALRNSIRRRLEEELSRIQREELKEQLLGRLIEAHSFTPPPSMVERQTRYLLERYQDRSSGQKPSEPEPGRSMEEVRRSLESRATRQVQGTLLLEKISQLEKIEVTDREVQERVDNLARAAGERAKTVREIYSKAEARDELRAQMVFDKTLVHLLERARIKEVDASHSKVDE
jgi:trigger factor